MTSLIHLFHNSTVCVMNSRVSGQCLYTISASLYNNTYWDTFWLSSQTTFISEHHHFTHPTALIWMHNWAGIWKSS